MTAPPPATVRRARGGDLKRRLVTALQVRVINPPVRALAAGLREIAACPLRIVLLHYAPTSDTLGGEPREIWSFLGSERLAAPILEHRPDLVLHGHAHAGRLHGSLQGVPVYNVSIPVLGRDYRVFELTAARTPSSSLR